MVHLGKILIAIVFVISLSYSADWPTYHGNSNLTGFTSDSGPFNNSLRWNYTTGGIIFGGITIADNRVFASSGDHGLYAINFTTGSLLWNSTIRSLSFATPTVINGRVYEVSADGYLYVFNDTNGNQIWNFTDTGVASGWGSTGYFDDKIFFGSVNNKVYAINATTGIHIWNVTTSIQPITSSPSIVNGRLYIGSENNTVFALNTTTGSNIWNNTINGSGGGTSYSSPAYIDDKLIVGSRGIIFQLNATTGSIIWNFTDNSMIGSDGAQSTPAIAFGRVFIGSWNNRTFYALNLTTGVHMWNQTNILSSFIVSSPAVSSNELVYYGTGNTDATGTIFALNITNGNRVWNYTTSGWVQTSPAISNNLVIFGSNDGKFYAFNNSAPPAVPSINYTITYISPVYETNSSNITISFNTTLNISNVILYYNGVNYTLINTTPWDYTRAITHDLILVNNTNRSFNFTYVENVTQYITNTTNQTILWAYFIDNAATDTNILEGEFFYDYVNVSQLVSGTPTKTVIVTFNNSNTTESLITSNSSLFQYKGSLTAPIIPTPNQTFYLNQTLILTFNNTTVYRQTQTPTISLVHQATLSNCTGLATVPILNYTTYDEITYARLANVDYLWRGIIGPANGAVFRNYSFSYLDTNVATVCLYPANKNMILNSSLIFNVNRTSAPSPTYAQRTHFMDGIIINSSSGIRQIQSYLGQTTNVSNILFTVQDAFFKPVPAQIIRILTWNYTLNNYIEIESLKTDEDGNFLTNLIPNTKLYKFIILSNNVLVREFPDQLVTSSTIILRTSSGLYNFPKSLFNIQKNCNYNNNTKIVICSWTSSDSHISGFRLLVQEDKLIGGNVYCDLTSTQVSSGSLSCDLTLNSTWTTKSFLWKFGVIRQDSPLQIFWIAGQNLFIRQGSIFAANGVGIIIMIPLTLAVVFAFQQSITIQLIAITVILFLGNIAGFIEMTDALLAGFIALMAVAIHKIRS